jgi:hypothetical protein
LPAAQPRRYSSAAASLSGRTGASSSRHSTRPCRQRSTVLCGSQPIAASMSTGETDPSCASRASAAAMIRRSSLDRGRVPLTASVDMTLNDSAACRGVMPEWWGTSSTRACRRASAWISGGIDRMSTSTVGSSPQGVGTDRLGRPGAAATGAALRSRQADSVVRPSRPPAPLAAMPGPGRGSRRARRKLQRLQDGVGVVVRALDGEGRGLRRRRGAIGPAGITQR